MLGKRTYTTIDRSKPSVSIAAAGGAATTKDGSIPVSIAFSDDVAGPYPSTWTCVTAGSDPCTQFDYSAACSVPGRARQEHDVRLRRGCLAAARRPGHDLREGSRRLRPGQPLLCRSIPPRDAGEPVGRPVRHGHARPERAAPAGHRRPHPGTPDPGRPHSGHPTPSTPTATNHIPGGLKIGSLSILVPKRVKIGKVKQLVIAANASEAGRLSAAPDARQEGHLAPQRRASRPVRRSSACGCRRASRPAPTRSRSPSRRAARGRTGRAASGAAKVALRSAG